ncbi:FtsX-like permease family protein [Pseudoalteromonas sp. SMS1]|uniref:ABC transporter permease n=1 Tax=Pseudoalteromonas sp. SMS1 TaxID=2908894 RepID=UPI001F3B1F35|nr:ABC transporter permease [Pseudoalteromonas sp. SMS1]MCF2857674.1 FtsX-like permease family protein [Pseudoalteromonas sp. SMS1]
MEMFLYYIHLFLRNIKRTPLFFSLVILTLSIGIGTLLANLSMLSLMSKDPIPGKSEQIFSVNMNTYAGANNTFGSMHVLRYSDAKAILDSKVANNATMHYSSMVYSRRADAEDLTRYASPTRATTASFFEIMGAQFAHGEPWKNEHSNSIVIGHELNVTLFGGANSVGEQLELQGKVYNIVGVLAPWEMRPLFYHATEGKAFDKTDDIFVPIEVAIDNNWAVFARTMSTDSYTTLKETRQINAYYVQVFVELLDQQQRLAFQTFIDSYSEQLKEKGNHRHEVDNRLYNVNEWLAKNEVVNKDLLAFTIATGLFLLVCIFNANSLMLSRYQAGQFEANLRRAVGASKRQVFFQGVIESIILGLICALLSFVLAFSLLALYRQLFDELAPVAELPLHMLVIGLGVALTSSLLSTVYPLIQGTRTSLASILK